MIEDKYTIEVIVKGIKVIEYLSYQVLPQRTSQIAKALCFSQNRVFRILQTLKQHKWVEEQAEDSYIIGDAAWQIYKNCQETLDKILREKFKKSEEMRIYKPKRKEVN